MEEQQVSLDGKTFPLPEPFFVIATQNPLHQAGTYPLPESQLDRFLMQVSLGYPESRIERRLLEGARPRDRLADIHPVVSLDDWLLLEHSLTSLHVAASVLDYVQRLVECSRHSGLCQWGLSPRAAVGLMQAGRAWALIHKRQHVLPEDIQAVFSPVVSHRLRAQSRGSAGMDIARAVLEQVDVLG
jgi:MoxR-like ATPase